MKIQKTELAAKLNKIKGVVPKKGTQAILHNILVKDSYLIASDMAMTIKAKLEGGGQETFLIPERAFDLINNLPDGEVEISGGKDNIIVIKADKIENRYQTMDPVMFPKINDFEEGEELTIDSGIILESIKKVAYAIPAQAENRIMTAMYLHAEGGQLNFVGSDAHVLAWDMAAYDGNFKLLIPKNTVDKLKSLGLSGEVQIKHGKSQAVFITKEFEIYTRLIEGEYFKYQAMFKEFPIHTVASKSTLLDAMTRAKMCTEERCPVRFELQESQLNLSIKDKITDYHETVDLQENLSEPLTIGFDAKLVLETLKAFECDNVGISFDSPKMPMIIEAEDSDFKVIVLPVVLN